MLGRWRFRRRLAALGNASTPELKSYAAGDWPDPEIAVLDAPLLALDFELDGLRRDAHVLQAGWIGWTGPTIPFGDAQSRDIRSYADLDRGAVIIHGIGAERAQQGDPVGMVMRDMLSALAGRVLVAHGADIERGVVQRMSRALLGAAVPVLSICTLQLERRLHPDLVGNDAYRLMACRERYGLPRYDAHDALTDALAAAELLIAQLRHKGENTPLSALVTY